MAHGAAALRGAAAAGTAAETVIDGEFFSDLDSLETVQEDLAAEAAHRQIGVTTVVDELGTAATHCSIERGAPIQANQVNPPCVPREGYMCGTPAGFTLADSFTGVLDDPVAARDHFLGEHSVSLDARTANAEPEAGKLRSDARNVTLRGHIKPRRAGRGRQSAIGNPPSLVIHKQINQKSRGPCLMVSGFVCGKALAFFSFLVLPVFFFDAMFFSFGFATRCYEEEMSAGFVTTMSPTLGVFSGLVASSFFALFRRLVLLLAFFDAIVFLLRSDCPYGRLRG